MFCREHLHINNDLTSSDSLLFNTGIQIYFTIKPWIFYEFFINFLLILFPFFFVYPQNQFSTLHTVKRNAYELHKIHKYLFSNTIKMYKKHLQTNGKIFIEKKTKRNN